MEIVAKVKLTDANGLALMAFGFSTFMFFAFLCNVGDVGGNDEHNGVFYLGDMLCWGVAMALTICGIFQGLNGDHLGFTSYIFHGAILGTIGHGFKCLLGQGDFLGRDNQYACPAGALGGAAGATPLAMLSYFCYAAFWFNVVFTIMAFRIAKMFGVLYTTVALMFLLVGLNWQALFSDEDRKDVIEDCDVSKGGPCPDRTGDYLTGLSCLIVSLQCFYLLLPVLASIGPLF